MKGDAILVDLDRVARDPWIDPEFDIADAFVERAMGTDVATSGESSWSKIISPAQST